MKVCLFTVLILLSTRVTFSQSIPSAVYGWEKAPVTTYAGYEDRLILSGSTRDFANLSVHGITLYANQPALPAQQLDEEELVIVKGGELTVTLGQKTKALGPGSVVMIMPGDLYRLENKSGKPATYYTMRYTSGEMPDIDLTRLAGGSFWGDWNEVPFKPHDKGGIRRMFDCGTVMTKRFEMHVTTLNPGFWSHPPHTHRAAEILLMVSNTAQESIDGVLQPAGVGDLIFLESNVPHAIQNTGKEPCTYFAFQFE